MLGDSTNLSTEFGWRGTNFAQQWRAFIVNTAARMNLPVTNSGTFDEMLDTFAVAIAEKDAAAEAQRQTAEAAAQRKQNLQDWVTQKNADIAAQLNTLRDQLMQGIRDKRASLLPFVQRGEIPATTANGQIKSMINDAKKTYSDTAHQLVNDAQAEFELKKGSQ